MADLPNTMWLICRAVPGHPAHGCVTGRRAAQITSPLRVGPGPAQAVLLPWTCSRSSARGSATRPSLLNFMIADSANPGWGGSQSGSQCAQSPRGRSGRPRL